MNSPTETASPRQPDKVVLPQGSEPRVERCISSQALLAGQASVTIDHQGVQYILRATRAGKLILTK